MDSAKDHVTVRLLAAVILLSQAQPVLSHAGGAAVSLAALPWSLDPWVWGGLTFALVLYLAGLREIGQRTGQGRATLLRRACCFVAGWLVLFLSLLSPLDALGKLSFAAHMVQHELQMIVAAPLLVLGRPFAIWMWGVPSAIRQGIAHTVRAPLIRMPWDILTRPAIAWLLHAAALWIWHAPALFQSSVANEAVHVLQHLSFLITALLFWWTVLGRSGAYRLGGGAPIFYLFTTMLHSGVLGALLAMSDRLWYPVYAGRALVLGLEPLEDQQLGGLIMWIPAGLVYLLAGLVLCLQFLQAGSSPEREGLVSPWQKNESPD